MTVDDLPAVGLVAARIHHDYPEEETVFAERLRLHPAGCQVLDIAGRVAGYALSHPWLYGQPPKLNTLLLALPREPSTYYIHDIALLPEGRGTGAASRLVVSLSARARASGHDTLSLVAVHDSTTFWERHGFRAVHDPILAPALYSYGEKACFMVKGLA